MDEVTNRQLVAADARIAFDVEGGMARLWLQKGGKTEPVGEGLFSTVASALLTFLQGLSKVSAVRHPADGEAWQWIFSTGVPYHFFFGRRPEPGFFIKVWNGDEERLVAQFELTGEEAKNWASEIERWLSSGEGAKSS